MGQETEFRSESSVLLPGDILRALETIELENYIIRVGDIMYINASAFDKHKNQIISFQTSLTSVYNPNVQKQATVLIYYNTIAEKTELFQNDWNPYRFRVTMLSYYAGFKNLTFLTTMQMIFMELILTSFVKEFKPAIVVTILMMIGYCIMSLNYYGKAKSAMYMIQTLRQITTRKESENAYVKCVKFINKSNDLIENYQSIGMIQFLIIALVTGIFLLIKQLL